MQFASNKSAVVSAGPQRGAPAGPPVIQFTDEEIKHAFDTFDLDKNRFVGAAELSHILSVIGEEVTDQEIDEMISMCDGDGDGQVTFDEFYRLMTQPPPPLPQPLPSASSSSRRVKKGAHSGSLVRTRVSGLVSSGNEEKELRASTVESIVGKLAGTGGKIKPSQIKKVYRRFQDIDTDGSGQIEYKEFIHSLDLKDNENSKQIFSVFDTDRSGSISLKEFIVVLSRYTTASHMEKMKFSFMMFDEDGSGAIERSELLRMVQASFLVEALSESELLKRVDAVYSFLGKGASDTITYEDYVMLSNAKSGLIYPVDDSLGRGSIGSRGSNI